MAMSALQERPMSPPRAAVLSAGVASLCGFAALTACICMVPSTVRGDYIRKFAPALAAVCIIPGVAAVSVARWAIIDPRSYKLGHDQGVYDTYNHLGVPYIEGQYAVLSSQPTNVQPTTRSEGLQPFVLDTPQVAAPTAVAARRDKLRVDSSVPAVSAPVRNQFDFLTDLDD